MHRPKDFQLISLAFWLDSLEFSTQLNADELDKVHMLWNNNARARGMTRMPRGGAFMVQFSLGGILRTLGKVTSDKTVKGFEKAVRFSDMARQYFSKYRTPDPRGSLNFSVWRVTEDLKHELKLVDLLKRIEQHLLSTNSIKEFTRADAIKAELKSAGPVKLVDVLAVVKELGEKSTRQPGVIDAVTVESLRVDAETIKNMRAFVEDVSKQLTAIREQNAVMIDVLKLIVARVAIPSGTSAGPHTEDVCCSPIVGVIKTGV